MNERSEFILQNAPGFACHIIETTPPDNISGKQLGLVAATIASAIFDASQQIVAPLAGAMEQAPKVAPQAQAAAKVAGIGPEPTETPRQRFRRTLAESFPPSLRAALEQAEQESDPSCECPQCRLRRVILGK